MPVSSDDVARRRQRRREDTRRWRSRRRRGVQLFQLEAGPLEYDLAVRYGGLRESQMANRAAVKAALARALRKAVTVLLHEGDRRR